MPNLTVLEGSTRPESVGPTVARWWSGVLTQKHGTVDSGTLHPSAVMHTAAIAMLDEPARSTDAPAEMHRAAATVGA